MRHSIPLCLRNIKTRLVMGELEHFGLVSFTSVINMIELISILKYVSRISKSHCIFSLT